MYKKYSLYLFLYLFIFAGIINANTNKLSIFTSIKPISQIAKEITKNKAVIKTLIDQNSHAHSFSPKPSVLKIF
jgi:ABC-type Zn uptake system ZnuABC Zn-binding protein ZnuA